jgi:hypothetical protein
MLTSRVVLTGISIVIAMGGCAVRPLSRRQLGQISTLPALAVVVVVVVVVVVDRRRQEVSLQAEEEVVEAEAVRPARVRRRPAVRVLAEEASEEVGAARAEVEPLPVVTLAPQLPAYPASTAEGAGDSAK